MSHAALFSACQMPLKSGFPFAIRGSWLACPVLGDCAAAPIATNRTDATEATRSQVPERIFLVTIGPPRGRLLALRTLVLYSCAGITRDDSFCQDCRPQITDGRLRAAETGTLQKL